MVWEALQTKTLEEKGFDRKDNTEETNLTILNIIFLMLLADFEQVKVTLKTKLAANSKLDICHTA